jgi:hypothetical protein
MTSSGFSALISSQTFFPLLSSASIRKTGMVLSPCSDDWRYHVCFIIPCQLKEEWEGRILIINPGLPFEDIVYMYGLPTSPYYPLHPLHPC